MVDLLLGMHQINTILVEVVEVEQQEIMQVMEDPEKEVDTVETDML